MSPRFVSSTIESMSDGLGVKVKVEAINVVSKTGILPLTRYR